MENNTSLREHVVIASALALGGLGVYFDAFLPGFALGGEIYIHLIPALQSRISIASGNIPLYTDLWYGGRLQLANPLWLGWYPPAWILYTPWIPIKWALRIVVAVHLAAIPIIAYWHWRDVPWFFIAPFAMLWLIPIHVQANLGHLEKLLAWPWAVWIMGWLAPEHLRTDHRRTGLAVGIGLGGMFLSGGNYYAVYFGAIVGSFAIAYMSFRFIKYVGLGALIGFPHAISILLSMGGELLRPDVIKSATIFSTIWSVSGLYFAKTVSHPNSVEAFGWVGPAIIIAWFAGHRRINTHRPWVIGGALATIIILLLASASPLLYELPGVSILRNAPRATVGLSALVLLFIGEALRFDIPPRHFVVQVLVILLLLSSLIGGVYAARLGSTPYATEPYGGDFAASIQHQGCDAVWMAVTPQWEETDPFLDPEQVQYHLVRRGIAIHGAYYGFIGQEYQTRTKNGNISFDAIVVDGNLNASQLNLTRPYRSHPTLDTIPRNRFSTSPIVNKSGIQGYELDERCKK
jgi:hypothetical protein